MDGSPERKRPRLAPTSSSPSGPSASTGSEFPSKADGNLKQASKRMSEDKMKMLWDHCNKCKESSTLSFENLSNLLRSIHDREHPGVPMPDEFLDHVWKNIFGCLPGFDLSQDRFFTKVNDYWPSRFDLLLSFKQKSLKEKFDRLKKQHDDKLQGSWHTVEENDSWNSWDGTWSQWEWQGEEDWFHSPAHEEAWQAEAWQADETWHNNAASWSWDPSRGAPRDSGTEAKTKANANVTANTASEVSKEATANVTANTGVGLAAVPDGGKLPDVTSASTPTEGKLSGAQGGVASGTDGAASPKKPDKSAVEKALQAVLKAMGTTPAPVSKAAPAPASAPSATSSGQAKGQLPNGLKFPDVNCSYFLSGNCRFGTNCAFKHPGSALGCDTNSSSSSSNPLGTGIPLTKTGKTTGVVCKNFATGTCRFGDKCAFEHSASNPFPKPSSLPSSPLLTTLPCFGCGEKDQKFQAKFCHQCGTPLKTGPASAAPKAPPGPKVPCKFHMIGTCRSGKACPFEHVGPSGLEKIQAACQAANQERRKKTMAELKPKAQEDSEAFCCTYEQALAVRTALAFQASLVDIVPCVKELDIVKGEDVKVIVKNLLRLVHPDKCAHPEAKEAVQVLGPLLESQKLGGAQK